MINHAFSVPVGQYDLNRELTKQEKDFLDSLEMVDNQHNLVSDNSYVLETLSELKKELENIVNTYANEIFNLTDDAELYITQSWVNHTNVGQRHHKHYHYNSLISGSLYIDVEPMRDAIELWRDEKPFFNLYKDTSSWFPCEKGRVYLFPSHIEHSVRTVESGNTRVSLAFNTFIKGEIGTKQTMTRLII